MMKNNTMQVHYDVIERSDPIYSRNEIEGDFIDSVSCEMSLTCSTKLTNEYFEVNLTFFACLCDEVEQVMEYAVPYKLGFTLDKYKKFGISELVQSAYRDMVNEAYMKLQTHVEQFYKCTITMKEELYNSTDLKHILVCCDTLTKNKPKVQFSTTDESNVTLPCSLDISFSTKMELGQFTVELVYSVTLMNEENETCFTYKTPYSLTYTPHKYEKYGKSEIIYHALKETVDSAYKELQEYVEMHYISQLSLI